MTPKVDIGGVIEGVLRLYRERFGSLLGAGLAVMVGGFALIIAWAIIFAITVRSYGGVFLWALMLLAAIVVLWAAYHASIIKIAQLARAGRVERIGVVLQSVRSRIGALILTEIMIVLSTMVLPVMVTMALGPSGAALGLLLFLFPGLYFAARFAVAIPVVVIEKRHATDAMERSWNMSSGNVLRIFVLFVIGVIATFIVQLGLQLVLVEMTGHSRGGVLLNGLISNLTLLPLFGLLTAVIYFELLGPSEAAPAVPTFGLPPATSAIPPAGVLQPSVDLSQPPAEVWDTSRSMPPPPPSS